MRGGAIIAGLNVTLDIQETIFIGNKASDHGGAINVQYQAQLRITNCVFDDNLSQRVGGAITASYNVTLDIQETTFVGNKALSDSGAIDVQQAYLRITNCIFQDNKAQRVGGAITASVNVTLDIQEATFAGNKAVSDSGAIDVQQAYLRITKCEFEDNESQRNGGAIACALSTSLDIKETNFTRNKAVEEGGAIMASNNVTLNILEVTFVGNKALTDGGAIDVQQAQLQITKCVFDDNISQRNGGAIVGAYNTTLDINETHFTRNTASEGGAINIFTVSYFRTTDCTFKANRAERLKGGAISAVEAVLEIDKTYFVNNSALQGGAIDVQENVYLSLTNSRLEHNFASVYDAGAINAGYNVMLRIRETKFTGNSAAEAGGALRIALQSGGHVEWCIFHNNTAKTAGGAVDIESKSKLQIKNTKFEINNSTDGGAISIGGNS